VNTRILDPVYDNEKDSWWILTNKEIYTFAKKPTITETTEYITERNGRSS
jgi:hypothetical protein